MLFNFLKDTKQLNTKKPLDKYSRMFKSARALNELTLPSLTSIDKEILRQQPNH